jgi:DNA-binding response OmpR family regulator
MAPIEHKLKVLIVDDKPENLYTLEKLLENLDVAVHQAASGFEAVELTVKHDFAVAIVDVQMPEMDGYELVEFLRHKHNTKTLPVIFVSAIFSDEYHHRKGYEAGAVDFMSKPFNPDILLSKVKVFLELYHQRHQLQAANDKLAKRALELETSSQVAQYATSILELGDLLPEVVSLIQAMFNYYFVGLWLVDEGKKKLVLRASQSRDGCRLLEPDYVLPLDTVHNIVISAYQSGEYYLANDVTVDPQYPTTPELPDTRSELVLPLRLGTENIGILDLRKWYCRCWPTKYLRPFTMPGCMAWKRICGD